MATKKKKPDTEEAEQAVIEGVLRDIALDPHSVAKVMMVDEMRNLVRMMVAKEVFGMDVEVETSRMGGGRVTYRFTPIKDNINGPDNKPIWGDFRQLIKDQAKILAPTLFIEITKDLTFSPKVVEAMREYLQERIDDAVKSETQTLIWNRTTQWGKDMAAALFKQLVAKKR